MHTTVGTMKIRQPRVHDKREGEHFRSSLLPPFVRRTMAVDALVPVLYLHGVSTTRMTEVLKEMVGAEFSTMSASVVTKIIERWQVEYRQWSERRITKRYVYVWVDGIYTRVRTTNDRPCMLVVIGCDERGNKEVLAVVDGERESELSWTHVLTDLKRRGLAPPQLAIGDGALGFWNAMSKVYPSTTHQGCTVHALRNCLGKLPKSVHGEAKSMFQDIFTAPTREEADKALTAFEATFKAKYSRAVDTIARRYQMLIAFYAFPAEHWKSIRSTNVIESTFATIRRRSKQTNGNASRDAAIAMIYALAIHAQRTWRKLDGFHHIANVLNGVAYINGERKEAA